MATLITAGNGAGYSDPIFIQGYDASRESRNIVHDLIGGGIAVTLVRPRPDSGELPYFFDTYADARAAYDLHREETTFTVHDDDLFPDGLTYIVTGLRIALDDKTREHWHVTVGYQAVEL